MEVIDLTSIADSPPPKEVAPDARQARRERRREQRRAKEEREPEDGPGDEDRREDPHRKRKRSDSRERRREARRGDRSREDDGRKPRRESPGDRDSDRKRSRRRKHRDREPDPPIPDTPIPDEQLFFIDEAPAPLPSAALYTASVPAAEKMSDLILPAHVSVFGETPIDIPATTLDSDEDDYIEYLDYDNRKDFVRYYDEEPEERRTKIVCKKCGAEDEHTTAECHVLICLTCGVRDEHPTRSCNIGKTCFTCGMKGHINADCPNRYSSRAWNHNGCERCSSSSHQTSECPGLWRMYVYVEDTEQKRIVQARKDRKGLALGQGGEGYIADDEWCYNCGGAGHWGDDCREFYHPDALVEPTAFSFRVLSAGPFAPPQNASGSRAPRDWERDVSLPGGVEHVGRRAKKKEMEKLTRRAQLQEADDSDNWFQNRNVKNRRESEREHDRPAGKVPTGPKMAIGPSSKEAPRPFQFAPVGPSSSKVSLSDRLSDPKEGRRDGKSHAQRRVERDRALDSNTRHRSDRERNNIGHRDERGPRYRGGYAR